MFAKHLPPSAGLPRVLALDARAAAELAGAAEVETAGGGTGGSYDAIAGRVGPEALPQLMERLRPGGRAILAAAADPAGLLAALESAGFIHCLVEEAGDLTLYRGERPPHGSPLERVRAAAGPIVVGGLTWATAADLTTLYIFLLVTQTPNKPSWKLTPEERVTWKAATVQAPNGSAPALLAFSSLLKAVAFMQSAILGGAIAGINKVAKFPAEAAHGWALPLALNPAYEAMDGLVMGPAQEVDPRAAVTGDE